MLTKLVKTPGAANATLLLFFCAADACWGQSEAALKRYFEGRSVTLRLDMPATKDGVDVYYRRDPSIEMRTYSERIKRHGISLRNGDRAPVTAIRLKGKNIEFQIAGGGYGTAGDDTGNVSVPIVSKTSREIQLEKEIRNEGDRRRREDMERELSRLRSSREREQERRRTEAMRLQEERSREIRQRALDAGSRFNIWYPDGYLREAAPTPEDVMMALRGYVEFGGGPVSQSAPPQAAPPGRASPIRVDLRRGMTPEDVRQVLGSAHQFRDEKQGNLAVHGEMWDFPEMTVEIDYVEGVLVKYRISSH